MSSPVTTDTDATQHPDTTRPGNDSQWADSAHKQLDRTSSPTRLHLSPLSAFLRRIARLTTQRELRTPRVPATQQQWPPASQLEARARSRDVPTATYVTHYGAHSLNPKTRALPHYHDKLTALMGKRKTTCVLWVVYSLQPRSYCLWRPLRDIWWTPLWELKSHFSLLLFMKKPMRTSECGLFSLSVTMGKPCFFPCERKLHFIEFILRCM